MSVIVCIHCLYHCRLRLDIFTILFVLSCIFIYELAAMCGIGFFYTMAVYCMLILYCIRNFHVSLIEALSSVFLMMMIMAIMQFFFSLMLDLLFDISESERGLLTTASVLGACITVLPKCGIYRLRFTKKRNRFLLLLLVFPVCMIFYMQYQQRKFGEIQLLLFIFAMPMVILFLVLMGRWIREQNEKYDTQKELQVTRSMQEQYDELIKTVRVRQHEFKNHLAAILATHYTYKSYDRLVTAQEKYCNGLIQENRYNELLTLGDIVLVGFLYEKICEIEKNGIEVRFVIRGRLKENHIPVHHLVEMMGILLDNASQAVQVKEGGRIVKFEFAEDAEHFYFRISNPFSRVSHDEMEAWFLMGRSTKGQGRGLGLYRVRCLCQEDGCYISYRNVEEGYRNWIEFEVIVEKADKR